MESNLPPSNDKTADAVGKPDLVEVPDLSEKAGVAGASDLSGTSGAGTSDLVGASAAGASVLRAAPAIPTQTSGNTSGMGEASSVPPEVNGWNWGAFFLTWIWGVGNSTYASFLSFVPVVSIAMPFVLGAKGNAWAWRNKHWNSVEHFHSVQRGWALAGLAMNGIVIFVICGLVFSILTMMGTALNGSVIYQTALARAQKNPQVQAALGVPVKADFGFFGTFDESETVGKVDFRFPVSGPKSSGQVYLVGAKTNARWTISTLEFIPRSGEPIDLRTAEEQKNAPAVETTPEARDGRMPQPFARQPFTPPAVEGTQKQTPTIKPDSSI